VEEEEGGVDEDVRAHQPQRELRVAFFTRWVTTTVPMQKAR